MHLTDVKKHTFINPYANSEEVSKQKFISE